MNAYSADRNLTFQLPSLSYIDAKWEEPNLRAAPAAVPVRKGGLAGWLSRRLSAFVVSYRARAAGRELAGMSDHELMDIGLSRADLARVFTPEFNEDLQRRGA